MSYKHISIPANGTAITVNADLSLNVPDQPIIPFIEGDGIGVDITPVMKTVIDAAISKAYALRFKMVEIPATLAWSPGRRKEKRHFRG